MTPVTEIDSELLALAQALIERPSVTPEDAGCQDLLVDALTPHGFVAEWMDSGPVRNLWLRRGSDGPLFAFAGHTDVVPTGHHIQPAYIMAYDMDVARSFENRSLWLERAAKSGWLGLFYHDARRPFGRIEKSGARYRLEPVEGELVS